MLAKDTNELVRKAFAAGILTAAKNGAILVNDKGERRFRRLVNRIGITEQVKKVLADGGQLSAHSVDGQQIHPYTPPYFDIELYNATQSIKERWAAEGGHLSVVGLPIGDAIDVKRVGDGFRADFRSGFIRYINGVPETVPTDWCRVWWTGLECGVRQESEDEVYGTVFCHAPGRAALPNVVIVPGGNNTFNMGPPGTRVVSSAVLLYEGPLVNVTIGATLIENDSGDVEEMSQEVAQKITQGGAALLGGLVGAPADAIANQTWYQEGIGLAVGLVLDGVFGIGDDPYTPQSIFVPWQEIAEFRPPQSYQRPGNPQIITYSKFVDLTGTDDGGDFGHYRFYYMFEHMNPPG